ncbi:hypothetical protein JX265_003055 [Neoarthrinium moseri]|uniref:Uncharacterized protein n=1 Tax=Neoarthrinium moseri TaxID=1658444 RepID=A0A9Q0ASH2_9PEZI|nr:hypothetical protein JX266_002114 [Neoarthrinium moseri]KAI1878878.1 hypothetical protein JX265_003055 [Neoarthrinium moseri]
MSASPTRSASTTVSVALSTFPEAPLTTTFTPPPQCTGFYRGSPNYMTIVGLPTKSCMPSGFAADATSYFSPGVICPSGYYSACHDTRGYSSITTVTCCPTRGDFALSCVKSPNSLTGPWENLFCTWAAPETGMGVPLTETSNGITSTVTGTATSPQGLNAYGVRMVYQSTDLSTTSTASVSSSGSTLPSTSPTETDTAENAQAGGLSTGVKAAIGVVVPLVVLGALAGIFLWRRRHKKNSHGSTAMTNTQGHHKNVHETGGGSQVLYHEVDGRQMPAELGSHPQVEPVEMPSEHYR